MILSAYARAAKPGSLDVWVGIFDQAQPPLPQLTLPAGTTAATLVPLAPIADYLTDKTGHALNHRALFRISGLTPGQPCQITVAAGEQRRTLNTASLPNTLPGLLGGESFNILLCSCYSQPEDAAGLLGTVVSQIKLRPDFTLLMGDQIYGDLPVTEKLPGNLPGIARVLGSKYRQNWLSRELGGGGLGPVLARAPWASVADDHEFWNNYPYPQTQLPTTWQPTGRSMWQQAATQLYQDYQWPGTPGGCQRFDIDVLKILLVDMRSRRDPTFQFQALVETQTAADIQAWAADLLAERAAGRPAFGLLSSGQSLFRAPTKESKREQEDAEMSNYGQFDTLLLPALEQLSAAGIPVIYVTGDVHWSRVAQARDARSGRLMLHEVIVSPSRLIRIPVLDSLKEAKARVGGFFGKPEPWPRHSKPDDVPRQLGRSAFRPEWSDSNSWSYGRKGDTVAVMSVRRAGSGIDFWLSYYGISDDKALSKSSQTIVYELRNI